MVLRKMTPSDYENFLVGEVIDILVEISNLENNEKETAEYVYDERSVDRVMGIG